MADQKIDFVELLQSIHEIFAEKIPFHRMLGLRIEPLGEEHICIKIEMKEELVGNYLQGILHGGVISAVLDVAGGITAWLGVLKKLQGDPLEEIVERFSKIGTIDLRIDYLRPGRGKYFLATGSILRTGNKVAVTRMELHNDEELLVAVGTGTYIVG